MALRRQRDFKSPGFSGGGMSAWGKIDRLTLLGGILLIAVGFWIFWPAIHGGWLWDDGLYIIGNDIVHSPEGYWKAWVNPDPQGNYYPLTTLAEWVEWRLWGDETFGYHLVTVALHVTSALLLWRLFRRLGFAFARLGAALFLVHPLMVESVAWVSELKNTLALPPLLMAMLIWLDYDEKGEAESYRATLVWFILSLAAKTSGLMLPVFFLGYVWWKNGVISRRDLKISAPFFAVALVAGLLTLFPPHQPGAHTIEQPSWDLVSSLASMGWTTLFLFDKSFFPVGLLPDYPGFSIMRPTLIDFAPWLLLAGIAFILWIGRQYTRWIYPVLFGLGFFLINLVPVLIFVGKNYPDMTWSLDHLIYLPIIGLIGWSIAWLGNLQQAISPRARVGLWGGIAGVLMVFCWGSHSYARVFASEDLLMADMMEREPQNWQVHDVAGNFDLIGKRYPDAAEQFQTAVTLKPDSEQAHFDLGRALEGEGKREEAKNEYLQAAGLNAHQIRSYLALGAMMQSGGNLPEAEKYLDAARTIAPKESTPIAALAGLMVQTGRTQEAFDLYEQAIKMTPDVLALRYNYGVALLQAGHFQEAVEQLQAAVDLDGNMAPARENLGSALAQTGNISDAIEQFEAALKIDPTYLPARDNLGLAYAQTGHLAEAIEQFQKAVEMNPNDTRARDSLAKLLKLQNPSSGK